MIRIVALVVASWASGAVALQAQTSTPPEWQPHGRAHAFVHSLFGPGTLLGIAGSSTVDQLRNDPHEWGDDAGGLGRRIASNAGRSAVQETVRHGLAAVMDRSVVYQRCTCAAGGARFAHAFVEAVTDRDRSGHRWVSVPRFAGAYGGALVERSWRPGRSPIDVVSLGTGAILFASLANLWREFVSGP